jgi:hypothetical protein
VSTAGHEAAVTLAFNLSSGPESLEGGSGVTSVVVTPTEGSSAGVLSQATGGSVQQVSQFLSLSGTTLDLAATLLTVSVVEIESAGGTSATGASAGPGPGQGSSQSSGISGGTGEAPVEKDDQEKPAIHEIAPAWERLVIGLERSCERARAAILEFDGRLQAAKNRKSPPPPAPGRQPAPAGPTTNDRSGADSKAKLLFDAAMVAHAASDGSSPIQQPANPAAAVDAALADLERDREAAVPLVRRAFASGDGLAQAPSSDLTGALVVAVVAGTKWASARKSSRRRHSVSTKAVPASPDSTRMTSTVT